MKHLLFAIFSVFATACAVSDAAPAPTATEASAEQSIAELSVVDPQICAEQHAECTPPCLDLVGNAKGACLRLCLKEYKDCLAGH